MSETPRTDAENQPTAVAQKAVVLLPPTPWVASEQQGKPGGCFRAQVYDDDGMTVATITATMDPEQANRIAKIMAASFDLLLACKALLHELPRNSGGIQARRIGQAKKAIQKAGDKPYC